MLGPLMAALLGSVAAQTSLSSPALQPTVVELAAEADRAFVNGKFATAEAAYLQALDRLENSPEATSRQPKILSGLAAIYNFEGRYAESESLCIRAITMVETTSSKTDLALASMLSTLGTVDLQPGKMDAAAVVEQCKQLANIGVDQAIFNIPTVHEIKPLEVFARDIIPAVAEL